MFIQKFKDSFKILPQKIKLSFIMMIFYSILISIFEFFGIASIPLLFSTLLNLNETSSISFFEKMNLVFVDKIINTETILILVAIIFFLKFCLSVNFYFQESSFRKEVSEYFRIELYQKFLRLNFLDQINYKKGDLLKRVVSDPSSLASLLINYINIIKDFLIILIILTFLLNFNLKVTLISFFIIAFLSSIFTYFFKKKVKFWGIQDQTLRSELNTVMDNSFASSKEIKVMGFEKKFINLFSNLVQNQVNYDFKNRFVSTLPRSVFEILIISFVLLFVYYIYRLEVDLQSSLIQVTVYIYAFARLLPSSNAIVSNVVSSYFFFRSVDFIEEGINLVSDKKNFLSEKNNSKIDLKKFNTISFKDISVKHKDKFLIKDLSFSLFKNKINIIQGPSGVGKSTCLNILSGLIRPSIGGVYFDDKLVSLYDNDLWQSNIGYVSQSNYLFNTSIMENITFQNKTDKINSEKYHFSLNLSNLVKVFDIQKIENFIVGINGNKVSGGQAQKILFARSLYFGQNFLILDEPTNGLDDISIKDMISSLSLLVKEFNYTIILSTHENFENIDSNTVKLFNKTN